MRVVFSLAASIVLLLALVGPAAATGPGCSDYGAATVEYAQAGHFGTLVSSVSHGALAPTFSGVSELVQWEHGQFCRN